MTAKEVVLFSLFLLYESVKLNVIDNGLRSTTLSQSEVRRGPKWGTDSIWKNLKTPILATR